MSDPARTHRDKAAEEAQLRAVWANPKGWRYWTTVNNTQIGLWYGSAAFSFMLFAGLLGLLIRAQLAVPENDLLSAETYNQVYTLHGTVMMFLFAVPIFEAVAIFLLPPMLGARELPFPRLGAFGFWSFLIGGVFVAEAVSVMLQTSVYKWFKRSRGKEYADAHKVFRMAPLHHHFEKLGWAETTVVTRFYILGIFCALLALSTLKIR